MPREREIQGRGDVFLAVLVVVVTRVIAERVEEVAVDRQAPDVAGGGRADQRKDQVIALGHAPAGQGHAKVVVFQRDTEQSGRVLEAEEGDR